MQFSTASNHRSALNCLYRDFGQTIPFEMKNEMAESFKNMKKSGNTYHYFPREVRAISKVPLPFSLYTLICEKMLACKNREFVFARTYFITSWNLMSRAVNIEHIRYSDISWRDDALCIQFAHFRVDQNDERPRYPRRIYSNPKSPEICPILALGVYLLSFTPDPEKLFPGRSQHHRYLNILQSFLTVKDEDAQGGQAAWDFASVKREVNRSLTALGLQPKDIGTHSVRLGAASYCSSASTFGPPPSSIQERAGMGNNSLSEGELKFEAAGDCFVGRTVAGLPLQQADFALLPPHFTRRDDVLYSAIRTYFPNLPSTMDTVLEHLLASVVYHLDYLKKNLDPRHSLWFSSLFRNFSLLEDLKSRVVCCMPHQTNAMKVTGLPPHVYQYIYNEKVYKELGDVSAENKLISESLKSVTDNFKDLSSRVLLVEKKVQERLGRSVADKDSPAPSRPHQESPELESYIRRVVTETIRSELDERFKEVVAQITENVTTTLQSSASRGRTEQEGSDEQEGKEDQGSRSNSRNKERQRTFPPGLEFKEELDSPISGWILWYCGSAMKGYPPFKDLPSCELTSRDDKKRLSDLRFLIKSLDLFIDRELESKADESEREQDKKMVDDFKASPTVSAAEAIFYKYESKFYDWLNIDSSYNQRRSQLKWSTFVKKLRKRSILDAKQLGS
eukprot:749481-Hanusia_phi.AAC.23